MHLCANLIAFCFRTVLQFSEAAATSLAQVVLTDDLRGKYGYFRDVNIMIFFGFGMLMTFLRRYG